MTGHDPYELLDFGNGRKLERFGDIVLDRPSPAAARVRRDRPEAWQQAAARFIPTGRSGGCGQRGRWEVSGQTPLNWTATFPPFKTELRLTEFGHVGIFPEQSENWRHIQREITAFVRRDGMPAASTSPPRVLNLFAYTGASTLAAAAACAQVVHVDASRSTVAWARRNADLSGLSAAPIRWIVEDARRFVTRERKRGSRYHAIILDPPSHGHGPRRSSWQIDRDLADLLHECTYLLADDACFVLLTCHSPGMTSGKLAQLGDVFVSGRRGSTRGQSLHLTSSSGRRLNCGYGAWWSGNG